MRSKLKELPADQLEVLHLSATEYKRLVRGDDEIEVNEKMYDIARVEIVNDKVMVYCLQDSSEDNLLSFLDQVVESATQDSQQAPSSLFQFSSLTFILPFVFSFNNQLSISICSFTNYAVIDCSFTPTLDTPPPRG